MGSDIRNFQTAEGLDDDAMAALLTARLGRVISPAGYRIVKGRPDSPAVWLEALNIAPQEPTYDPDAPPADEPPQEHGSPDASGRASEAKPPAGVLPFEPASARMQISIMYTVAGRGASIALRSPQVAEVWALQAPAIADGYIEWAKENSTVAHYINILTFGGPAGKLLMLHAGLLVQTLIVANPDRFGEGMLPPNMRRPAEPTDLIDEGGDDDGSPDDEPPAAPPRKRTNRAKAG